MEFVRLFLSLLSLTALLFLIVGLYRPWIMLWWEAVQNRKKVIKLYGSVAVTSYIVYWLLYFIK